MEHDQDQDQEQDSRVGARAVPTRERWASIELVRDQDDESWVRLAWMLHYALYRKFGEPGVAPDAARAEAPTAGLRVKAYNGHHGGNRKLDFGHLSAYLSIFGMRAEADFDTDWYFIYSLADEDLTEAQRDLRGLLTAPSGQLYHVTRVADFVGTPEHLLRQMAYSQPFSERSPTGDLHLHVSSRHGSIELAPMSGYPDLAQQIHMAELHLEALRRRLHVPA